MNNPVEMSSQAWLLRGISSVPGQLELANGHLRFTALGPGSMWKWKLEKLERETCQPGLAERMNNGECTTVFDAPLSDVETEFPWYYFSGGLKLRAGPLHYRFSFGQPSNTRMPISKSNVLKAGIRAAEELTEAVDARRAGKAWKRALGKESSQ